MLRVVEIGAVKWAANSFHRAAYFDRIQDALFHQYVLETLSLPREDDLEDTTEEEAWFNDHFPPPDRAHWSIGLRRAASAGPSPKAGTAAGKGSVHAVSLRDGFASIVERAMPLSAAGRQQTPAFGPGGTSSQAGGRDQPPASAGFGSTQDLQQLDTGVEVTSQLSVSRAPALEDVLEQEALAQILSSEATRREQGSADSLVPSLARGQRTVSDPVLLSHGETRDDWIEVELSRGPAVGVGFQSGLGSGAVEIGEWEPDRPLRQKLSQEQPSRLDHKLTRKPTLPPVTSSDSANSSGGYKRGLAPAAKILRLVRSKLGAYSVCRSSVQQSYGQEGVFAFTLLGS